MATRPSTIINFACPAKAIGITINIEIVVDLVDAALVEEHVHARPDAAREREREHERERAGDRRLAREALAAVAAARKAMAPVAAAVRDVREP